jgi:hypothetical protein
VSPREPHWQIVVARQVNVRLFKFRDAGAESYAIAKD